MTETHDLVRGISELYEHYLARGCPCRFPRFRALAKQWGLPTGILSSADRDELLAAFPRLAPLVDRTPAPNGWSATCSRCRGSVTFSDVESSPGGFVDYLVIATKATDLGAPFEPPLKRCRLWRTTGPGYDSEIPRASRLYVHVDERQWLDWLSA